MKREKIILGWLSVIALSGCNTGNGTASYQGTTLKKGVVSSDEKAAVSNLYDSGVRQEEKLENGETATSSTSAPSGAASEADTSSSTTEQVLNYKAEYHFSLDVKHANQAFSFERQDKADATIIAIADSTGTRAKLTRSHTGMATLPFGSWSDSEETTIVYQDGYAFLSNSVSNSHFANNGKFAYAIPVYANIYEILSSYEYRLSDDLKFEDDDEASKEQADNLIDEHKVTIESINGKDVTIQFVYSAKGTYTLTFDTESGRIASYDLKLDAAYEAKEKETDRSFQSGSVSVEISAQFTYGGQKLEALSKDETNQYTVVNS
jgi:hypothetical protein